MPKHRTSRSFIPPLDSFRPYRKIRPGASVHCSAQCLPYHPNIIDSSSKLETFMPDIVNSLLQDDSTHEAKTSISSYSCQCCTSTCMIVKARRSWESEVPSSRILSVSRCAMCTVSVFCPVFTVSSQYHPLNHKFTYL